MLDELTHMDRITQLQEGIEQASSLVFLSNPQVERSYLALGYNVIQYRIPLKKVDIQANQRKYTYYTRASYRQGGPARVIRKWVTQSKLPPFVLVILFRYKTRACF